MNCPTCRDVELTEHETSTGDLRHVIRICPECGATYVERPSVSPSASLSPQEPAAERE